MPQPTPRAALGLPALAVIVPLLLAPAVSAQPNGSGEEPPTPSLTVTGSGEVRAEPDRAVVRLGVEAQHEDAARAQAEASRIARAILDGVAELGVPEEAIQTSRLVLHPLYDQRPRPQSRPGEPREPEIVGYRASNVVSVRLEDLAKIGPAIDAAVGAGANRVEGVEFELEDDVEARQQALRRAVAEARAKARAMAEALEVELGAVLDAQEGGVRIATPRFGGPQAMMMESRTADTPVAAGEITVSAEVTLRYRID